MPIRKYNPTSPGRRGMTVSDFSELSKKKKPEKRLVSPIKKSGGRNNLGRTTSFHRGGGHKRRYRVIDFRRNKWDIPARVAAIEYDPNRSAHIALLHYADGEKRYILAPNGLGVGERVETGLRVEIAPGNAMPLKAMPLGTIVHNVELKLGKGAQLVRAAGGAARLMAREGKYVTLKLPSGETRFVLAECLATIGQVGNLDQEKVSIGKAGRNRWLGKRPNVRGVAMNPVDHPHGGGEGKSSGGRHPVTPWGVPTKGHQTRRGGRSDKFIIRRRKKK